MRLAVLFQFPEYLYFTHVENIIGIGGLMFFRYPQDVVRIAGSLYDPVDIRHSSVIENFSHGIIG